MDTRFVGTLLVLPENKRGSSDHEAKQMVDSLAYVVVHHSAPFLPGLGEDGGCMRAWFLGHRSGIAEVGAKAQRIETHPRAGCRGSSPAQIASERV